MFFGRSSKASEQESVLQSDFSLTLGFFNKSDILGPRKAYKQ